MNFFYYLFRTCAIDLSSFLLEFLEEFVCVVLFSLSYKRRKLFPLRLAAAFVAGVVLCCLFAMWKTALASLEQTSAAALFCRIFTYTAVAVFMFGVLAFCWREKFSELVVCWCTAIAVKTVAGKSFSLLLNICGVDDKYSNSFFSDHDNFRDFSILAVWHIAIFVAFAFLYRKRKKLEANKKTTLYIYVLSAFTVLITTVLSGICRIYEGGNLPMSIITKIFMLVCMAFVLVLIFGILERNKLSQDLEITEQLLTQEKRRYEMSKETVEIINMKCHDLKHRLSSLEDKLNEREIEELKEAIKIYDSNIKTGNEILDVVLYEKQLLCEKSRIKLTCLADGKLLSFVSPSHLYALFGNAIDNAVEAVKPLVKEDKRLIGITLRREENLAVIEICNYFSGRIEIKDGLPETSKEDGNRHGYGMRSMKYVAESYGGTISAAVDGDMFTLTVGIPVK